MTSALVFRQGGEAPETIFTNEYDFAGRVVRQTLADGRSFAIEYTGSATEQLTQVKVTEASGRVLTLSLRPNSFVARAMPVRFPGTYTR